MTTILLVTSHYWDDMIYVRLFLSSSSSRLHICYHMFGKYGARISTKYMRECRVTLYPATLYEPSCQATDAPVVNVDRKQLSCGYVLYVKICKTFQVHNQDQSDRSQWLTDNDVYVYLLYYSKQYLIYYPHSRLYNDTDSVHCNIL